MGESKGGSLHETIGPHSCSGGRYGVGPLILVRGSGEIELRKTCCCYSPRQGVRGISPAISESTELVGPSQVDRTPALPRVFVLPSGLEQAHALVDHARLSLSGRERKNPCTRGRERNCDYSIRGSFRAARSALALSHGRSKSATGTRPASRSRRSRGQNCRATTDLCLRDAPTALGFCGSGFRVASERKRRGLHSRSLKWPASLSLEEPQPSGRSPMQGR